MKLEEELKKVNWEHVGLTTTTAALFSLADPAAGALAGTLMYGWLKLSNYLWPEYYQRKRDPSDGFPFGHMPKP